MLSPQLINKIKKVFLHYSTSLIHEENYKKRVICMCHCITKNFEINLKEKNLQMKYYIIIIIIIIMIKKKKII